MLVYILVYLTFELVTQVWGAEVHGVAVKQDLSSSTIDQIKEAASQYVGIVACFNFTRLCHTRYI